jgi:hypothetical protein
MPIPLLALAVIALLLIDWRVAIVYLLVLFIFQSYSFTPDTYWLLQYVDFLPFAFFAVAFFRRLILNDR